MSAQILEKLARIAEQTPKAFEEEKKRKAAEEARVTAEDARVTAEKARETAEIERESARESFENSVNSTLTAQNQRLDEQDANIASRLAAQDAAISKHDDDIANKFAEQDVTIESRLAAQEDKISEVYEAFENGDLKGDAYILTETDKEEIADISTEALQEEIGDIEAALNVIIAIQEELTAITFTFITQPLKAPNGMTWGEWIDSKYNTIGARVCDGNNVIVHDADTGDDLVICNRFSIDGTMITEGRVLTTDVIREGYEYTYSFYLGA